MPSQSRTSSFDTLRTWDGSQARAFEELSYQLLKGDVPVGSTAIRTGNPDGGVEWYATLGDGSEWGWQAKHVHGIDALLTAMTESVARVATERPRLARLTFVVSSNLATSTRAGSRKSQRQKYEDKVAHWRAVIPGAANISFELVQGSDVLDRLALPEHRGRGWFWWGDPVLSAQWLNDRLREQADAAGDKYRPDLQVDLPIQDDLRALGFDSSIVAEFERLRRGITSSGRDLRLAAAGPSRLAKAYRRVARSAKSLVKGCDQAHLQAGSTGAVLPSLTVSVKGFLADAQVAESIEFELERNWRDLPRDHPDRETKKPPEVPGRYRVHQLRERAVAMEAWLGSSVGQTLERGLYFLTGPAGSGKTHLFLDGVHRALSDSRPAVALAGARFGRGDLWASICDQLGLEPVGGDVLLGAMDAAGEASTTRGRRFVIFVDALNETPSNAFWLIHLPALRAAVARWPHVALAVSCRDTYLEIVDDGSERNRYQQQTHPGFAGREVEATQRYFAHYGLEAPRIPLLVPEFSLPLFLRLYCESLIGTAQPAAQSGHESRVRIFERYVETKLARVARRFRPDASTGYELSRARSQVANVVDALLDEFASTGQEATPVARGEELAASALAGSRGDAGIVLGALQSEGVLSRELLYLGDGRSEQGFRIVYQAFADFLILRRRIAASADPTTDAGFRTWLRDDCSWGILDAAAVALPELFGQELPDFLDLKPTDFRWRRGGDAEARRREGRARHAFHSVAATLPHRDAVAITDRTIELLNASLSLLTPTELYRTIISMAPQPDNRLNGDGLHRHLLQLAMPKRDSQFGFAMYHEIWEETSPVVSLARWASCGPYPSYDPRVVELACIPLMWLLSSPNRFMRDWVTKALVQLLRGHLGVMRRLLDRFYAVDDPYVVQRVVVIAYGALMRSDPSDAREAGKVAAAVHKLVFTRPVRADELLLDAGRGAVEWAVTRSLLPERVLDDLKRPYGMAAPRTPQGEDVQKRKYGYLETRPETESYSTIWFSLFGMGDFARYVVDSGLSNFSRHRLAKPYPERRPTSAGRFLKGPWKAFVRSLSAEQQRQLEQALAAIQTTQPDRADLFLGGFDLNLTKEQSAKLDAAWKEPLRRKWRDDRYPSDRAHRWIFQRTLSLGWTPRRFGREDRSLGHGRGGREAHKAERWGKKYQWMAYHELLARVADNFHAAHHFDDSEPYEGMHQIIGDREIDPSLPPVEYRDFAERGEHRGGTWREPPIEIVDWPPASIDFARYRGDIARFIEDRASEPTLDKMAFVTDATGARWVLLDASISQGDPAEDKNWQGLQQPFALDSWFSPKSEAASLLPHLAELRHVDHWDLVDTHGHVDCCYAGEVGWSPHACRHFHRDFHEIEADGRHWRIVPTTETVVWEGSLYDCSIDDAVSSSMPSSFVQARSKLVLDERGPSWLENGEVVITSYGDRDRDRSRALLVRDAWLRRFLHTNGLEVLYASWHERWSVHDRPAVDEPWENVNGAARLDADLNLELAQPIRESLEQARARLTRAVPGSIRGGSAAP